MRAGSDGFREELNPSYGLPPQAEHLTAHIKNSIGISTQVKIVAPETLQRSVGKAKRVVDQRTKG
jgi:phenylacetate-CoA ligase